MTKIGTYYPHQDVKTVNSANVKTEKSSASSTTTKPTDYEENNIQTKAGQLKREASLRGYDEYYDISISADGKYLQVKVKSTPWYINDPDLSVIKKDFLKNKSGVIIQKGRIGHGNEELIEKRLDMVNDRLGRNTDYDQVTLRPGDTINLPVNEIYIREDGPSGFWGRL